ncbi:DUF3368 domain-containing protein [Romeria aff. gracilis LEGE 07310]|uniref:DUF3368 domain-containing protein n=1 Tax=Vasconcelosia minhoensis LEGE 07310 TaxID=915328 RepID=A0A8J7DRP2_9CYAN|nr:DUF3368 domain-containing protein [Romeria gracilis]MBE9078994.1 DUF3368 domain-containing protein [Romeria aff. gracilis LEGE 07310]
MVKLVVSNTSPLSNLGVIGKLPLLRQIYPKLIVPSAVYKELAKFPTIQGELSALVQCGWLKVLPVKNQAMLKILSNRLDPGEAAAISLAIEIKAHRLLIDERLGRQTAIEYGLKIRGILGILANAKALGMISALRPILDELIEQAGFWVSPVLYQRILKDAGEI